MTNDFTFNRVPELLEHINDKLSNIEHMKKNWKLCRKRRYLPRVLTVPNLYMFVVIATVELYVSKSLLKFTDKKLCMLVCLIDEAHLNEIKLVFLLLMFSNKNSSTHKRLLGTLRWVTASANEIQRKDLGIIKVQGVRRVSDDVTQHILNSISANVQCSLELIRAVILSGRACKCRRLTHDNSHQTPSSCFIAPFGNWRHSPVSLTNKNRVNQIRILFNLKIYKINQFPIIVCKLLPLERKQFYLIYRIERRVFVAWFW